MKKLLLDTSVIIDFLRSKNKQTTLLLRLVKEDLYISIITHVELYAGRSVWEKSNARKELEDLLSGLTILPLEEEISKKAGEMNVKNNQISLLDCIIGASALHHGLELVTFNIKEFRMIPSLILYQNIAVN